MASVTTTSGVPAQFESGNTVPFTMTLPSYPPGTWTLAFVLSSGTTAPVSTAATTSGTDFLVTLSAAVTAALTPGVYQWAAYVSTSSQRTTASTGTLTVLPNLAVTQTASFAQSMVTALQTVLATFASTDKKEVDFNGQKFVRQDMKQYQEQFVFWKAQLLSEQSALAAQRGEGTGGRIAAKFLPSSDVSPIYNPTE